MADAFVWVRERDGGDPQPLATYPERLGRWPGAVTLFAFASLELAYSDPAEPTSARLRDRPLLVRRSVRDGRFGRDTWEANGEGFAVLYDFLARMAPFHVADGRIRLRWPLTGLAGPDPAPGSFAFVAVMLGTVLFDGTAGRRRGRTSQPAWRAVRRRPAGMGSCS